MIGRKKKKIDKKALIKKAYVLGFEVGYYKHYEAVGWVRREREKLEKLALEYGIEREIREAYNRGKLEGEKRKSLDLIEEKSVSGGDRYLPTRGLEAISLPAREPKLFHLPKFLKRYRR